MDMDILFIVTPSGQTLSDEEVPFEFRFFRFTSAVCAVV
jgi:hypothetical protein